MINFLNEPFSICFIKIDLFLIKTSIKFNYFDQQLVGMTKNQYNWCISDLFWVFLTKSGKSGTHFNLFGCEDSDSDNKFE